MRAGVGSAAAVKVAATLARVVRAGGKLEIVAHDAGWDSSWRLRIVGGTPHDPELDATDRAWLPGWDADPAAAVLTAGVADLHDAVCRVGKTRKGGTPDAEGKIFLLLRGESEFRGPPAAIVATIAEDGFVSVRAGSRRPECAPIAEELRAALLMGEGERWPT